MFQNIIDAITGCCTGDSKKKIRGTVVLIHDRVHEFLGQGVSLQLVSAVNSDPSGTCTICSSSIILLLFHYLMPFQP
jgi:hypothetical protein